MFQLCVPFSLQSPVIKPKVLLCFLGQFCFTIASSEMLTPTYTKEINFFQLGSEASSPTKLLPDSVTPSSDSLCGPEPTSYLCVSYDTRPPCFSDLYLEGGKCILCSCSVKRSLFHWLEGGSSGRTLHIMSTTSLLWAKIPAVQGHKFPLQDDACFSATKWQVDKRRLGRFPGSKDKWDDFMNISEICWWCDSLLGRMHVKGMSNGITGCTAWKYERQLSRSECCVGDLRRDSGCYSSS